MGRLDVRICAARNLADTEWTSKPDPYCIVKLESQVHKTSVKDNSTNPTWDEVFKFTIADEHSSQLIVELWNKNVVSDEFLGQYSLSLAGLTKGIVKDGWYLLQRSKTNAELHLRVLAVDFGIDPTPAQLAAAGPQPHMGAALTAAAYAAPAQAYAPAPQPGYPAAAAPGYPPQQSGYPPQQQPGYPPQQQSGYPPQQGGYPPQQGGYPPQQGGYPPQQGGYPPQQSGYPPQQSGYPPQQGGYPPQQSGYPPQQSGYPPQQSGYPPQQAGYGGAAGGTTQQVRFKSWHGQYVRAHPPQNGGRLDLMRNSPREWELFNLEFNPASNTYAIRTHHGSYVDVENDGQYVSRERRFGEADQNFTIFPGKHGRMVIRNSRGANWHAKPEGDGFPLQSSTNVDDWEVFIIEEVGPKMPLQ